MENKNMVNKRRLKALGKRITNQQIADEIGVSVSTVYRYKNGSIKNPKRDVEKTIDKLWKDFKTLKPTTKPALKKERYNKKETLFKYTKSRYFEFTRTIDHVFKTLNPLVDLAQFEDFIDEIFNKINSPYFYVRITGMAAVKPGEERDDEETGKEILEYEQSFQTPITNINIDGTDGLWKRLIALRSLPSKVCKRVIFHEIICKQFFDIEGKALTS